MAQLWVRDQYTREFAIDASALPFWEGRVEVIREIPEFGEEPANAKADEPPASGESPTSAGKPDEAKTSRPSKPPKPAAE